MNFTKIICTIGPAVNKYETLVELIQLGMNVARLNFSHGTYDQHKQTIQWLKQARESCQTSLSIMLDTKGPEIRVGTLKKGLLDLNKGDELLIVSDDKEGNEKQIPISPLSVTKNLTINTPILFDDGYLLSKVIAITEQGIMIKIEEGGRLKSGKGVNIPGVKLDLPALTQRDIEDIIFACKQDVDIIAASFIRSSEHVLTIKRLLNAHQKSNTLVFSKIENNEGLNNFDTILSVTDGIMIARGDLGVELPLSTIPKLQKMMIK